MRFLLSGCLAVSLMLSGALAHAGELEDEAKRQVELAKEDFANGIFDRSISACNSALRLDPAQREAFKVKGFALEQVGREKEALAMLRAYQSLSTGIAAEPAVDEAIARLETKLEVRVSPVPAILGVGGAVLAVGGAATAVSAWARIEREKTVGYYWGSFSQYDNQRATHITGLILTGAGVGLGAAGLVAGLVQSRKITKSKEFEAPKRAAQVLPWMGAGPDGATMGIVGRW
jgi:tetratricopeptide (TPR) repeat protein